MEFKYAPGLPGYGTQGIDGSNGLLGIAIYYSDFDGTTDATQITARITDNKILFAADEYIPGWPDRIYQTGDMFVDKNGRVFEIDFDQLENFSNTGSRLNTSTIFVEGTDTEASPIYTRYSNSFGTEKFLVDNVYAATAPNNYALAPESADGVYGIGAVDYGQIKYVDNSINGGPVDYHPYTIWTNTNDVLFPERAIALVKEDNADLWRFGNLDGGGSVRDVDLSLDFETTFANNINTINDVSINNHLYVDGNLIHMSGGTANYIRSDNWLVMQSQNKTDGTSTYNVSVTTGNTTGSTLGGNSGRLDLLTGNAGNDTASWGGNGGEIKISSGYGGNSTAGGGSRGGAGGVLNIDTGKGGNTNGVTNGIGGTGGKMDIDLGIGGNATGGTSGDNGGLGGIFTLNTGSGGSGYNGGKSGECDINLGTGGTATNAAGTGGVGGWFIFRAGTGGANHVGGNGGPGGYFDVNNATIDGQGGDSDDGIGGVGGRLYLRSGRGGGSNNSGDTGDGGDSGAVIITGNWAGNSLAGQPGDSGVFEITGGRGGRCVNSSGDPGSQSNNGGAGGKMTIRGSYGGEGADNVSSRGGHGGDIHIIGGSGGDGNYPTATSPFNNAFGNGGNITIEGSGWPSYSGGDVSIRGGTAKSGGTPGRIFFGNMATSGTVRAFHLGVTGVSSEIYATSATPSDSRLKDLHGTLDGRDVLNNFDKYHAYNWTFNEQSKKVYDIVDLSINYLGMIAQDIQGDYPELIQDLPGNDGSTYLIIDYTSMAPLFLEAIKVLNSDVSALNTQISVLSGVDSSTLNLISDLENKDASVDSLITILENKDASIQSLITDLENKDASTQNIIEDLIARIEALEDASTG